MQKKIQIAISFFLLGVCVPALMLAQGPPPTLGPGELDNLVQRIALYPDAILANILTAATYPDQIPEADQWADQHAGLHGDALAHAIGEDHLPWDPSVQAMLPFPRVLETMARDPSWTQKLGDAVLSQRGEVMDAVQRMRHAAERYGYLQTNAYYSVVNAGGFIEINPINPGVFVVPIYDPGIVFVAPRPGIAVRAAISFGPRLSLGVAYAQWGWGPGAYARFNWDGHGWYVNNHEWGRSWVNRREYVHPWSVPHYERAGRIESHRVPEARRPEERRRRP